MKSLFRRGTTEVILLTLCSFLLGCSKQTPTQASSISDSTYFGSWNWIRTAGGYTGGIMSTPGTLGYSVKIELTSDSILKVYHADTFFASGPFSIHREWLPNGLDSVDVITCPDTISSRPQYIRLIGRDTLNLVDQCMDCYSSFYSRAQ